MTDGQGAGAGYRPARPILVRAPDGIATPASDSPAKPDAPAKSNSPAKPAMIRQYELTEKIHGYDPKADTRLIDAAYVMAMQAHGTQRRDNGDPYFSHPVAVADILAGYRLDTASIATGLLHDVIEDTPVKLPENRARFC